METICHLNEMRWQCVAKEKALLPPCKRLKCLVTSLSNSLASNFLAVFLSCRRSLLPLQVQHEQHSKLQQANARYSGVEMVCQYQFYSCMKKVCLPWQLHWVATHVLQQGVEVLPVHEQQVGLTLLIYRTLPIRRGDFVSK